MLFRPFALVLLCAGAFSISVAQADVIVVQNFDYHSPSGVVPPLPYSSASGTGQFSFNYALIQNYTGTGSVTIPLSDILSFNFSATLINQANPSQQTSFSLGLQDLTSLNVIAIYQPNNGGPIPQRVYDFNLTANPVLSSNPDWGTAGFQVNYANTIVGVDLRFPNSTVNAPVSPGTILVQSRPLELIDTPEPSTFGMLGTTGLLVLAAGWKRSRRT